MIQSRSGVACSLTLNAVPSDLDLYVYLNIDMAIFRLQWVSFAAMPSRTLNPLSVVTVGSMSGVFWHWVVKCDWVVKFLAARLWAVCYLYTALYYLHE